MTDTRRIAPLAFPSEATLTLPGSKSEANRLLVLAALSGSPVKVTGASPSDDVRHLVRGLHTLGFTSEFVDESAGTVRVGPRRTDAPSQGEVFCGNAGTALRFLVSVAAITPGEWVLTGDERMQLRPIQPLVDAWRQLGVEITARNGCPPVRVHGGHARGGCTTIDGSVSSQYVSSLMLVGARLQQGLRVTFAGTLASFGYARMTLAVLHRVGIEARLTADDVRIAPGRAAVRDQLTVGGDWSAMGVWTCFNHLTGSRITADNLLCDSGQPDERLATFLADCAADGAGERTLDVEPLPDQFLNLAVVAALTPGTTHLVGAANTRVKECDRVAVMARELRRCGVDLEEHHDGLTIRGGRDLRAATIDPAGDHRVAMAFALLGAFVPGLAVADPGCVAKSYPAFWRDLDEVRRRHVPIAIVGMRGAGKTTFGRALAAHLGSAFVDTDEQFERTHGPIAAFVAKHGWPAFRAIEERTVAAALRTATVVATGGGAIESAATRAQLRDRAFVVFLAADADLLRRRIADSDRPSLTDASPTAELDDILARRLPIYRSLATATIHVPNPVQTTTRHAKTPGNTTR